MKLGDIKAEALKLMFLNLDQDIDAGSLSTLGYDETYASYLVSMPGSIRRALKLVANKHKLGTKSAELTEAENGKYRSRYRLPPDCLKVIGIVRRMGEVLKNIYDWEQEGEIIILPSLHRDGDGYGVVYYPKAPDVAQLTDEEELPVPEEVAEMIPYFIKGELYEDDEPSAAAQARNLFSQWIDSLDDPQEAAPVIHMVYGWDG